MRALKINIFIKESYNNVFFTLTNVKGQVIMKLSQGLFKESNVSFKRSKPFFYDKMIRTIVLELYNMGLFKVGLNRFLFKKFLLFVFIKVFGSIFNSLKKKKKASYLESSVNFVKYLLNFQSNKLDIIKENEGFSSKLKMGNKFNLPEKKKNKYRSRKNRTLKRYTLLRELYFLFSKVFVLFRKYFFINIVLILNGFFSRRLKFLILNLGFFEFLNIYYLVDYLPRAHNGCRPKKVRRL